MTEPAFIAGLASLASGAAGALITFVVSKRKDSLEYKLDLAAERVAKALLRDRAWTLRSIGTFQAKLPGLSDEELRKTLIRVGAISVQVDGIETWGLLVRNKRYLNIKNIKGPLGRREITVDGTKYQQEQFRRDPMQQVQLVEDRWRVGEGIDRAIYNDLDRNTKDAGDNRG